MTLLLGGTLEPTPLFELYHRDFALGPGAISIVFAAYAASLIPSLLLLGGLADRIGRRPAILIAFAGLVVAALVFACANGIAWLVAARVVQGVAMGVGLGAAAAAIREWMPAGGGARAGFWTVMGAAGGSAFGALLGGVLGEYAPQPRVTPYLVYVALVLVAAAVVWRVPERRAARAAVRDAAATHVAVPREIRRPFALAAAESFIGWAAFALFIALVPTFLARALGAHNLVVGALVITGVQIGSTAGSIAGARLGNRQAIVVAMCFCGAGVWLVLAGIAWHAYAAIAVATLLTGAGGGLSYLAGLNVVNRVAPPAHRSETISAYLVACYLGFSVPALGVGVAASAIGLFAAFTAGAIVLGAIAIAIMLVTTERNLRVV
jgi:MFS family permease